MGHARRTKAACSWAQADRVAGGPHHAIGPRRPHPLHPLFQVTSVFRSRTCFRSCHAAARACRNRCRARTRRRRLALAWWPVAPGPDPQGHNPGRLVTCRPASPTLPPAGSRTLPPVRVTYPAGLQGNEAGAGDAGPSGMAARCTAAACVVRACAGTGSARVGPALKAGAAQAGARVDEAALHEPARPGARARAGRIERPAALSWPVKSSSGCLDRLAGTSAHIYTRALLSNFDGERGTRHAGTRELAFRELTFGRVESRGESQQTLVHGSETLRAGSQTEGWVSGTRV